MSDEPLAIEPGELEEFYHDQQPRLLGTVVGMVSDRATAEDICQLTWVSFWRYLMREPVPANPEALLVTIAKRRVVDWYRRTAKSETCQDDDALNHAVDQLLKHRLDRLEDLVAKVDVSRALDEVTPQQRTALVLHYLLDLPVTDVAKVMNRAVSRVYQLLLAGEKTLRGSELLDGYSVIRRRIRRAGQR